MANHDDFWASKQSAAVLKHGVLATYLTIFVAMTSSAGQSRVNFIDAFAGPGKYEGDDDLSGEDGSPMIAIKVASKARSWKIPRELNCVFIERDPVHFASLRGLVERQPKSGQPTIFQGAAEEHVSSALAATSSGARLTFLDPYGTSLPYGMFTQFLTGANGTSPNEVLLNIHVTSIARIGAFLGRGDQLDDGDRKTLDGLDAFLGGDGWRKVFEQHYRRDSPGTATAAARAVISDFRERVQRETGCMSFPVEIRRLENHVPIFELVLFYRRGQAAYKFADAASVGHARWRRFNMRRAAQANGIEYQDALLNADFTEQAFAEQWASREKALEDELVTTLASNILNALDRYSAITLQNDAHLKAVLGDHLGVAGEKHLTRAWDSLASAGLITKRGRRREFPSQRIRRIATP